MRLLASLRQLYITEPGRRHTAPPGASESAYRSRAQLRLAALRLTRDDAITITIAIRVQALVVLAWDGEGMGKEAPSAPRAGFLTRLLKES